MSVTDLNRRQLLGTSAAIAATSALPAQAESHDHSGGDFELTELRDGIWRTRDERHTGLLIDTDEGILLFDTLNLPFAKWLNGQIAERFNKPVKWVVYSHNHADHVSGGQAFEGHNPRYISHSLARESMARMKVDTRLPDETFEQRFDILLGGRKIELRYHGPNDGRGSISLLLPENRVISAIDWLLIGRMPYRDLARYDVDGMIRSLHEIDRLDWDLASPGHADVGDKEGMRIVRRYLEAVRDGVVAGINDEAAIDDLVPALRADLAAVPEFSNLAQFDNWVELNIRGIHVQIARVEGHMDG